MFARLPRLFGFCLCVVFGCSVTALAIPPPPTRYFQDKAGIVSPSVAKELNETLAQFERDTSNQFVVAIFPRLEEDTTLEEFAAKTFQQWEVGRKDLKNGAVLFIFLQDRKMRIEVGYGLEGVLTDRLCGEILDTIVKPHFKQQDYAGGLRQGVEAMISAARGEFKGSGKTLAESALARHSDSQAVLQFLVVGLSILLVIHLVRVSRKELLYRHGKRWRSPGPWRIRMGNSLDDGWNSSGGGGLWSSRSGSDWGGGSGFFGGGGSSGGGGASSSW